VVVEQLEHAFGLAVVHRDRGVQQRGLVSLFAGRCADCVDIFGKAVVNREAVGRHERVVVRDLERVDRYRFVQIDRFDGSNANRRVCPTVGVTRGGDLFRVAVESSVDRCDVGV